MEEPIVEITYTNYRGEKGNRRISPKNIYYGSTQHHSEPQWLLSAYDMDKQAFRDFAMKDISSWQELIPTRTS